MVDVCGRLWERRGRLLVGDVGVDANGDDLAINLHTGFLVAMGIHYLEPGMGWTRQGYLWTGSRPKGDVFFHWETSRATTCLDQVVPAHFTGTLQCDGYAAYRTFAHPRDPKIILAGCWAHVRRKFYEATESAAPTAGWVLRQIQALYQVESVLR